MSKVNIKEVLAMTPAEQEQRAKEAIWDSVAEAVEHIAINRRVAEVSHNITPEEFDEKLNEICAEKNAQFCDMDEHQIHMYMLRRLLLNGNKEIIEMITR